MNILEQLKIENEIRKCKAKAKELWDKGSYAVAESLMDHARRLEEQQKQQKQQTPKAK
jgi:hypothetical protein